jgi:peptide/nickel transport system permease protein
MGGTVLQFIIRRLAFMALTLFIVSIVIFAVTEVLPGDAAQSILGTQATEESLAALRERLNLDQPAHIRYVDWLVNAVQGDFGTSLRMNVPVLPLIMERLGNSLALAGLALLISVPLAITLGVLAGLRRGKPEDHAITVGTLAGVSMPEFVVGVVLILIFSSTFSLLPSSSLMEPEQNPFSNPAILVLPSVTLLAVTLAHTTRMTRASMISVMQSDYVRTAILKGLPWRRVVVRHALPNALLPTITIVAINIGWMIGGLIVVETVFSYPGLGQLIINAITNRDVPLMQGVALLVTFIYAFANLIADVLYTLLNPRIRY